MLRQQPLFFGGVTMLRLVWKKPLALACTAFLAVLLVLVLNPFPYATVLSYLFLALLLAGSAAFFFIKRNGIRRALFITLLFLAALFLAFSLAGNLNTKRQSLQKQYHEKEVHGKFLVTHVKTYDKLSEFEGVFLAIDQKKVNIKGSLITFNRSLSPIAGDMVEGKFNLETTEGNSFLNKQEMASGKLLQGETNYFDIIAENVKTPAVLLSGIRSSVANTLDDHLSEGGSAMAKALLLADKSTIEAPVKEGFSALGIQHLFAVSGLHLSILIGGIASFLSHFAVKRRIAFPLLTAITLFYMALTGFAPSMLRSGGMLLLFYFSFFSHRHKDSVTALLVATSLIVLISPASILDAGLLLSFAATLGILLIANPVLTNLFKKPFFHQKRIPSRLFSYAVQSIISSFALSLSATAFILPILYVMNSKVVIFTFLSNLVFTPFFTLLLGCIPLVFLCLPFPVLLPLLTGSFNLLSKAVNALATAGHGFASLSFSLNYPFMPFLILLLLITLGVLMVKKKHSFLPLALILLFFVTANIGIAIADSTWQHKERVYYHTNQTSDSLLLYHDTKGMVIDFSYSSQFILESFETIENEFPSVKTDTLMLTNCRAAHIQIVKTLIERDSIRHLLLPKGSDNAEKLYQYAQGTGIDVIYYTPKDTVLWNDIALATHKDKTEYNVSAIEIKLANKKLLYLKENAPTIFDIRFGVMDQQYDVVFYGAFGLKSKSDPYVFKADTVVQGNTEDYIKETEETTLLYGDYLVEDKRK